MCWYPAVNNLEELDPILGTMGLIEDGRAWAGSADPRDPRLSPINGPITGLAPITVFVGTHELFNADIRKFRDMARDQGVDLTFIEKDKMNHVYPLFPIPEADEARGQIADVISGRSSQ